MKLLLVEDDQCFATLLIQVLRQQNHSVEWVEDGDSGWMYADAGLYDLLILDIELPGLDGLSLCRKLRSQGHETPILILTSRDGHADKIEGLDAGADDYIVKPCDLEELLARVRALLRRSSSLADPVLRWGQLTLDPKGCQVSYQQQPIALTPKEYSLLELFLRHEGRVFSLKVILEQLWSFEEAPGEETVRVHVRGLRQKLKKAKVPSQIIETVYGLGYRLGAPPDPVHSEVAQPGPDPGDRSLQPSSVQVLQALSSTWERFQPGTLQQVRHITTCLTGDSLTPEQITDLRRQVHQLKGLLGTYGLAAGSTLARHLETLLKNPLPLSPAQYRRAAFLSRNLEAVLSESGDPGPGPARILVISPDPEVVDRLSHWLHAYPLQVLACGESCQFLESWQDPTPELVIIDTSILEGPGLEQCRQNLRCSHWKDVPVITLVERSRTTVLSDLLAIGVTDFLYKPMERLECITRILLRLDHSVAGQRSGTGHSQQTQFTSSG